MNTPLLATNEPHEIPSLSGGIVDPDANSHLSLMLREASAPPLSTPWIGTTNRGSSAASIHRSRTLAQVSFLTVLVGSLTLIQTGLIWESFLSSSWLQVHLLVTHVLFTQPVDTVLQDLDLGAMVSAFVSTGKTSIIALLAMTTVMIPCCSMIVQSMTVLERHDAVVLGKAFKSKSTVMNFFLRFGFLVVFVVLILDIVISTVEVTFVGTRAEVQTRMGPGLISYTVGITMALISAKLLAVANVSALSSEETINETEQGYMRILECEEEEGVNASVAEPQNDIMVSPRPAGVSCCSQRLVLFECAVLSIFLWIAAFALPLFKVTYEGAVSDLLSCTTLEVRLANLVQTPQGIGHALLLGTVITQLFVFPLLALFFATGFCLLGFQKRWLSAVYPAVNSISLCAAVWIVIPVLETFGVEILNNPVSGLCSAFRDLTGESCLTMVGTIEPGAWFLVAHCIALEAFIVLTLHYSPKE